MGFLEVIGIASILPFMELVAAPDAIEKSRWLTYAYDLFHFESHREMLVYFGVSIIGLIGATNAFAIFTNWLEYKFSWDAAHHLAIRLLRTYLKKPYSYFLENNASQLQTYVISEVSSLTGGVLIPLIELFSRAFVSIVIFSVLLLVDVKVSLIMFVGLGGAYFLIYLSQKNYLRRIGRYRIAMNLMRYKNIQELFDGIKTVMAYNKQRFFFKKYEYASREFSNVQPKYSIIQSAPKNILEFLAFGSILGITIFIYTSSGNIQNALPRLSLYAAAGYRLLPALQKVFSAAAKIRHNFPVVDKLSKDLQVGLEETDDFGEEPQTIPFEKTIQLNQLHFTYENSDQPVLNQLNISIQKGETVAFIGSTGSGKTTLVDLIVGLLHPTQGHIEVDGVPLDKHTMRAWQKHIAYVAQEVFLFDDTILKNITLESDDAKIDHERLKAVTRMADIYTFISESLPEGFETTIGEKGVRLSGGQRQRLGLARALYMKPSVLVLDEATSALDSITEQSVIESLQSLPADLTTIIIAHRLSTVKHADCIYILEHGQIVAKGNYDKLMASNNVFKAMVDLS